MTTEEIKTLIDQKIAGQGNQVDSGGALAEILNALVDAVAENAPISINMEGQAAKEITDEIALMLYNASAVKEGQNVYCHSDTLANISDCFNTISDVASREIADISQDWIITATFGYINIDNTPTPSSWGGFAVIYDNSKNKHYIVKFES